MRSHGWDDLRVGDVAKEAGCGLATIYRRWETKEELVAAAIRARMIPPIDDSGDPKADLRTMLLAFAEEMEGMGESKFGFLAATRSDPVLRAAMDEAIMGTARTRLRELLAAVLGEDSRHVETVLDSCMGLLLVRDGLVGSTTPQAYVDDVLALIEDLAG